MSKKKAAVMNEERQNFIYGKTREDGSVEIPGCIRNGISEEAASSIFDEMASFASYAFNKSHAACYALVAYRTAYLKYYYPKEFMAALLTSVLDNTDKAVEYINECTRLGIPILPPDVNRSGERFTVEGDGIRFALTAIKNLGRGVIRDLVQEREENGPYTSFADFCTRTSGMELNRRAYESLIKCGACDGLPDHHNRRQMLEGFGGILDSLDATNKRNLMGQLSLFGDQTSLNTQIMPALPNVEEFSVKERLAMEKETIGLYLSGHPMGDYQAVADRLHCVPLKTLAQSAHDGGEIKDGATVDVLGIVAAKKIKTTKNNSVMAFVTLEDRTGSMEVIVFPRVLEQCRSMLQEDQPIFIRGRASGGYEEETKLVAETIQPVTKEGLQSARSVKKEGLFLRISSQNSREFDRAVKLLAVFDGDLPVYFRFVDTGKAVQAPRKLWISCNHVLVRELKKLLGEENVVESRNL